MWSGSSTWLSLVEGTGMRGDELVVIEDAHALQGGEHDQGAVDAVMGDGAVVFVKTRVRCLTYADLDTLVSFEGVVG